MLICAATAAAAIVSPAAGARPDKQSQARAQFERAVSMRTQLEGYLPKDRTVADYKQTVEAYHKVYLISTQAEEVTPAMIAEAELYEEMGKQFDPKYFETAIKTYQFLIQQYPGSRYRGAAELAIGAIQLDDVKQADAAEATYKDYLKKFPRSDRADDARQALKEIADAREAAKNGDDADTDAQPTVQEANVSARIPQPPGVVARVTDIHTWNAADHTRIVVTLDDSVNFESARLHSPDRIYFDLYRAQLDRTMMGKTIAVDNGLLKSVRVAQNKQGTVRLVLDVNGAKDYSVYQLANPNRLVIDVLSASANAAKGQMMPQPGAPGNKRAAAGAKSVETVSDRDTVKPGGVAETPVAKNSSLKSKAKTVQVAKLEQPTPAKPTRDGQIPLTRALGLKISRIVIDAGHGGKDTGTIGPHGLMEKDLCLDVALRLGKEIEEKLPGAQVIYTRTTDTFVPLEERTAIANQAKADLFISIHANSSHDHAARGVETYYLSFATSEEANEVAARENSLSQESLHDLQTLIQKIARNDKIEESRDLAGDIQDSLTHRLQLVSMSERNRGVKKAPFVVLIGANMPSVLVEISFLSNPNDERLLDKPQQRERIADGLYRGISTYLASLNSLSIDKVKVASDNRVMAPTTTAAVVGPPGNSK
ncbi:MAG TPA: N-acetylmuramoyl-L-alanine amidase [Verrucomicrobiae bacterium]|nr:N-acetylmuramoyl-L-alanine amidase [Verrucomicrobiae bacterium]